MLNIALQTSSQTERTQFVQVAAFTWWFLAKELCKMNFTNHFWAILASDNSPHPLRSHCTHSRTCEKAHCKSSGCTGFRNKECVWNCGKNFNIPKCQGREPLQLIGYLVPAAKLLTCWQITQTRNEAKLFRKWLSPLEFTTVYSAECPLLAPWIMYSGDSKPRSYICMKSITQQCIVEWRF